MSETGFTQFWIYNVVKFIYFNSKKYDITKQKLPKRDSYLKTWNSDRKDKDGMMFYKLVEKIPKSKAAYVRLYSYYYLKNSKFYISEIYNDEFKLWKKNEYEIRNLDNVVSNDFIKIVQLSKEKNIKLKRYFRDDKMPLVFKLYDKGEISVHSLIIFNLVFSIFDNLNKDALNIVELTKIKKYDMIFNKYYPVVKNYFKETDWKEYLQTII